MQRKRDRHSSSVFANVDSKCSDRTGENSLYRVRYRICFEPSHEAFLDQFLQIDTSQFCVDGNNVDFRFSHGGNSHAIPSIYFRCRNILFFNMVILDPHFCNIFHLPPTSEQNSLAGVSREHCRSFPRFDLRRMLDYFVRSISRTSSCRIIGLSGNLFPLRLHVDALRR